MGILFLHVTRNQSRRTWKGSYMEEVPGYRASQGTSSNWLEGDWYTVSLQRQAERGSGCGGQSSEASVVNWVVTCLKVEHKMSYANMSPFFSFSCECSF